MGEVVHIKEDEVTIRSGESRLVILRSGVANITNRAGTEVKPLASVLAAMFTSPYLRASYCDFRDHAPVTT